MSVSSIAYNHWKLTSFCISPYHIEVVFSGPPICVTFVRLRDQALLRRCIFYLVILFYKLVEMAILVSDHVKRDGGTDNFEKVEGTDEL